MTDRFSKAEKRQQRQEEKNQKRKEKSVRFAENIGASLTSKAVRIAPILELRKTVKTDEKPSNAKTVHIPNEEIFSNNCILTWCTTHSDVQGEWSWKELRAWTNEEWEGRILPSFSSFQSLTWSEILEQRTPASGGRSLLRNHFQEVSSLIEEAQLRWLEMGLEEYDTAFRFRFGNKVRAWGIKLDGHFYLVWWERRHKIYPVNHD
jgi:hypothetical protein